MTHVSNNPASARFAFDNTYARELEGFYVPWKAAQVARPSLVKFNRELAEELGLDADALDSEEGAKIFAGNEAPEGAAPLAQAYAGHQFGGFVAATWRRAGVAPGRGDRPQRHGAATFSSKARGVLPFHAPATAGQHSGRCFGNI